MLAPAGAASSEKVCVCTEPSASVTTGVRLKSTPSLMLCAAMVARFGARFGCLMKTEPSIEELVATSKFPFTTSNAVTEPSMVSGVEFDGAPTSRKRASKTDPPSARSYAPPLGSSHCTVMMPGLPARLV